MVRRWRAEWQRHSDVKSFVCGSCWGGGSAGVDAAVGQADGGGGHTHLVDDFLEDVDGQVQQPQRALGRLLFALWRRGGRGLGRRAHGSGRGRVCPHVVGRSLGGQQLRVVQRGRKRAGKVSVVGLGRCGRGRGRGGQERGVGHGCRERRGQHCPAAEG